MPCLLALLAVAFPRVAIVLLWLFSSFFSGVYNNIIIPVLGFLFLPLTLIVYTYLEKTHPGPLGTQQLIFIFIAVILDLGLIGGGTYRRRN
ncbi:MAG: hypothetical protein JO211_02160 [Acidobacteriaceae bacterium]|nr:hypothetical protein [Acidobacteriaceae bacterium]